MFDPATYIQRRDRLKKQLQSGLILFLGNEESPMNYSDNPFHFRQDSSFLYFFGLDFPSLGGVIDVDEDRDIIFGNDVDIEDIIWMGFQPSMKERAEKVGVKETFPLDKLKETVQQAAQQGKKVHYLPPYRPETELKLSRIMGMNPDEVKTNASEELIKAIVALRSIKTQE